MTSPTPNLGLFLPTEDYPMSDVEACITDNFEKIAALPEVPVFAYGVPLPQSGNYNVGSRVYQHGNGSTVYSSTYILVCKDANWGWHWRPIHTPLSPWVNLTNSIFGPGASTFTVSGIHPLSIAIDNQGQVWWRGTVQYGSSQIPANTSFNMFKTMPAGIRPNVPISMILPGNPVSGGSGGITSYIGGWLQLLETGVSTVYIGSTDVNTSRLWFNGMSYWAAEEYANAG